MRWRRSGFVTVALVVGLASFMGATAKNIPDSSEDTSPIPLLNDDQEYDYDDYSEEGSGDPFSNYPDLRRCCNETLLFAHERYMTIL